MSQFVDETLTAALQALEERRRKVQAFIDEAADLDRAIREQRKLLAKLGINTERRPQLRPVGGTGTGSVTVRLEGDAKAMTAAMTAAARGEQAPPREGTNADRVLKLLRDHPRGLNTTVIARNANVPQGSVSVVLSHLSKAGRIVRVGRGFWRIADTEAPGAAVVGS